jgi:hypothetical protein
MGCRRVVERQERERDGWDGIEWIPKESVRKHTRESPKEGEVT